VRKLRLNHLVSGLPMMTRRSVSLRAPGLLKVLGLAPRSKGLTAPLLLVGACLALGAVALVRRKSKAARTVSTPFGDGERDAVDEASWESFPASDAPSFSPGTG
jgi:hypothetical protein